MAKKTETLALAAVAISLLCLGYGAAAIVFEVQQMPKNEVYHCSYEEPSKRTAGDLETVFNTG